MGRGALFDDTMARLLTYSTPGGSFNSKTCLGEADERRANWELLVKHPDGPQPSVDQRGPVRDGELGGTQAEGVASVCVQVHLDGNAGLLQRKVVN